MKQHILSLSYGKDSMACLFAIEKLGWPLDRIIHAEIWATDTIPADLPPMVEFKSKADKFIKDRWGIEVEHICATQKSGGVQTFESLFYRKFESGKRIGTIRGFPMPRGNWCTSDLKRAATSNLSRSVLQTSHSWTECGIDQRFTRQQCSMVQFAPESCNTAKCTECARRGV